MTRGIYTAATGMLAEEAAQQVVAQNLANASTTGYKQDIPVFQSFGETLVSRVSGDTGVDSAPAVIGSLGHGAALAKVYTDLTQGPLQATGNPLDIALTGTAYLAVKTPAGVAYSRDGSLTLNAQGALVQSGTGYPVLSAAGATITVPSDAGGVTIDRNGDLLPASGAQGALGTLGLYSIDQANQPSKIGDNLIAAAVKPKLLDPAASPSGFVQSGYLEASNVSIVKEMVTMIACTRSYEANQKLLQSQDEMQNQAVSQVGQVAA